MSFDYTVEIMPRFRYSVAEDREGRSKRVWQVKMIERDDMGAYVKDIEVRRTNMTYDEASSLWNQLRQELTKAKYKE